MKKIILVTCTLLFASCMTEQKAVGWLTDHGKLPEVCAKAFPSRDSVGDVYFLDHEIGKGLPYYQKADNVDYSGDLTVLEGRGDSLLALLADKKKEAEKISNECADVVTSFIGRVDSLQRIIKNLRSNYKPPKPDTVPAIIPHYNLNPPELAACQLKQANETKRADKNATERDVYKQLFYVAAGVIILLIIIFALLLFLKFIKK